ncbi:hypothetical protein [uncultured Marixanthomonas sp.]|uniref:hypothetical protein n=1 Tax=uncultured Marixanthomonas sp. TaxID=757245 RepID=UPI0030DC4C20|tara:strand:+ start:53930 stop:54643 length:714 start_codon:yes stop_codon:yes gene_type:complete
MKKSVPHTLAKRFVYLLAVTTCCLTLVFLYQKYDYEQQKQEEFESLKSNLITELKLNYTQQVQFETNYWRKFYKKFQNQDRSLKYSMTKTEFKELFLHQSPLPEPDLFFKDSYWRVVQKKPYFMNRLTVNQLKSLQQLYSEQRACILYYNRVNDAIKTVFHNRDSEQAFEEIYQRLGSFRDNAFQLDLIKSNNLMYIETIIKNDFDIPLPDYFESKKQEFYNSIDQSKEIIDTIKPQ